MTLKGKKIKIDALIISDIHLGGINVRSRELIELIERYEFRRLILNGDILDGLHFNRLDSGSWEVLSKLRRLSSNHEVVWVHGNHDARPSILSNLLGIKVSSHFVFHSGHKKFLAIHGHQFDQFLINNYILSHIVYFFYNSLKRLDRKELLVSRIKEKNKRWKRSSQDVANRAIRAAQLIGADFVFCGHTHKLMTEEKSGITYMNGASWNEHPSGYIVVKEGKATLHSFDKENSRDTSNNPVTLHKD